MNAIQAQRFAIHKLKEHGLWDQGWRFSFNKAIKAFGVCRYRKKVISLSGPLTTLNTEAEVYDTVLHEIAHALAGYKAGHGPKWKEVCVRIGAKPIRCYNSNEVIGVPLKYKAICYNCSKVHNKEKLSKNIRYYCICNKNKPKIEWEPLKFFLNRR